MTVSANEALAKYGDPRSEKFMVLWDVPTFLEVGVIPRRIYCNRDLVDPLRQAFGNLIERNLADDIRTWDGCFNIRSSKAGNGWSLHAWGLAIDIDAAWNRFGFTPSMNYQIVECFTQAGFEWGGGWRIPDGMHFQLRRLP